MLRDEETILAARGAAGDLLESDHDLAGAPALAAAVEQLERSVAADFVDRS